MSNPVPALIPYGWSDRWATLVAEYPDAFPARVVRHDGAGLVLATSSGIEAVMFGPRLDPEPAVGDWIAVRNGAPAAVLARTSLLRRRTAHGDQEQALAANVDTVMIVCGLDRPVKAGRIRRSAALATDAGARPVVVFTKAAGADVETIRGAVAVAEEAVPGIHTEITSVREGIGLTELEALTGHGTVTVLGESGAGKSTIVNALLGDDRIATGAVRDGDAKGRHTTTSRELHVLPGGGTLIDTPGIRAVGLWVEEATISGTFSDIEELALRCRFSDCAHEGEPGCAITAAVADGTLDPARLDAWRELEAEAVASERRASAVEQRKYEKKFARVVDDAGRRKGR